MLALTDWIHAVCEAAFESLTCVESRDPVELVQEIEYDVIRYTGCNLNGKEV